MLISKQNRRAIYEQLFKDGVLVAKKDFNAPKHDELESVPNLQVIKAMQSLKSRGYVREQFAWRHYYWYITDEGIQYIRDVLHLPAEIVPATLKRSSRPPQTTGRPGGDRREGGSRRDDGGRGDYRRGGDDKKVGAGSDFNPEFRGGYGRGRAFGGQQTAPAGVPQ
ncbi:hypothetical protein SARC_12333 [Sphaeroforma arctica JP610]|uniref:Plectin/eS10 N-terminal domain-containing protein n=1 Tax=Sphaeroforma arctica JP610 TaxID=667725 RepID=A0A0L0FEH0_9EUKA|nr:hypothetical protein SARC_12333 [Sphaeroforma arctica JP610]KNC75135.1 hypothetical protein SARC_12333 [Sphaeroforma arctica JP610]|eukprot:XP_014149037.1 hypothetical protein SARC_12333 [Sphaeroforma arctica JP610]